MNRCTETDLLVEHCADCRTGKHTSSYPSRLRTVVVDPLPIRDTKIPHPALTPTVVAETNYLLGALDRMAEADWIDEAMVEIKAVWAFLTRVHGLISGPPLGHCFTVDCDGKVFRDRLTGFPACNTCHRTYDGIDALKLRLTEEAAG